MVTNTYTTMKMPFMVLVSISLGHNWNLKQLYSTFAVIFPKTLPWLCMRSWYVRKLKWILHFLVVEESVTLQQEQHFWGLLKRVSYRVWVGKQTPLEEQWIVIACGGSHSNLIYLVSPEGSAVLLAHSTPRPQYLHGGAEVRNISWEQPVQERRLCLSPWWHSCL